MNKRFWIGLLVGILLSALIFLIYQKYEEIKQSNRSVGYVQHPITGKRLSILVFAGISNDYSYIVPGNYKSLDRPNGQSFLLFKDSFGITYEDSSWVIYYLGDIVKQEGPPIQSLILKNITMKEYHELIKEGYGKFLYRYYF